MSIEARGETVICKEDGSGELRLADRPAGAGGTAGIAGQRTLHFDAAPEEITALNGCDIWGGDSSIMLGDAKIGNRQGYTGVAFVSSDAFKQAVSDYHELVEKRGW